jgi:hypothetical protein
MDDKSPPSVGNCLISHSQLADWWSKIHTMLTGIGLSNGLSGRVGMQGRPWLAMEYVRQISSVSEEI